MSETGETTRARILVVDDEPAAQRLLLRILQRSGYEAETAGDVTSALQLLEERPFDLVMTDLDMPGGSGFELIEVLGPRSPHIATVLVTGRGSAQVASHAVMAGAYGYLNKPFQTDEVEITLVNALRRRELELESLRQRDLLQATVRERTAELAASLGELQVARDELEKKAHQLQELDAMKSQFIQVISHELRTPLTIIRGGVQTVLRAGEGADPALREQLLRSVEGQAEELGRMITKILTVATINSGGIGTIHQGFRLDEAAREAVEEVAEGRRGRLAVRMTEAHAFGHRELLTQAIRDLIENAFMHTEGRVVVSTWEAGDEAVVSIADEGPSPSEELLQRLLHEPFVQGDSSTTRKVGGLGLSIYLANRIVEASAGRLSVDTSGPGSTFSIALPIQDPDEA